MKAKCKLTTFRPNRTTSASKKLATFRSTSINAPSTSQQMEKYLASLEQYSPTLATKAPTTTRHGSRLRILAQNQFYQQPSKRAHQQDQHRRNRPITRIFHSNTNMMYANTRRRRQSTRNTKLDLRRYVNWLQVTSGNTLYQNTTTASLGFFLSILSSLWTTSEPTM